MSLYSYSDSASADLTSTSPPKTQQYMDSLVPPSPDNFERIAHVQEEKELELKRRAKEQHIRALQEQQPRDLSPEERRERAEAARVIQKTFRGYRARRELRGFGLDATTRWVTAIREAQFRQSTRPRARSALDPTHTDTPLPNAMRDHRPSSARQNWKKVSIVARRAGHDDLLSSSESLASESSHATPEQREKARQLREQANAKRRQDARMMGLQYFLEMVDLKHRYGSNLRMYHEQWVLSDTKENFFYWLDYGEGKNIELDQCPRDRLQREQVRYLSREERQYYLVKVDKQGRLCWARNGARIDTTEAYKDSIHGIVPADDPTPAFNPSAQIEDDEHSDSSSVSSLESSREADRAAKYATPEIDDHQGVKKVSHLSASTIFNKLLRKSVKKNTWIFVADTNFRLYVGIKDSGAFQHSSFLQGSRISAAGLIKIKNGRLSSLSPLSGHYRPPASNFRAFVNSLKEDGADMTHVSISKSYMVLVGLEAYIKTRRKGKDLMGKMAHRKDKIIAPEQVARREEELKDKSQSAEKERQVLVREEAEREENRAVLKIMQKLKSMPVEPKGQKGGGDVEGSGGAA